MKHKLSIVAALTAALILAPLSACAPTQDKPQSTSQDSKAAAKVKVVDITGEKEVRKNPTRVVCLDNRSFKTLEDWGIKLKAVPKEVMPADSAYVKDDSVVDIGNHREPNLEAIVAADPELVIVGQRFAKYTKQIAEMVPKADVIDLTWNVKNEDGKAGETLLNGLKTTTETLGKIFDKESEAKALIEKFDKAVKDAKGNYDSSQKVMSLIVNGGKLSFSAPHQGRVWGPWYDVMGWTPALDSIKSSTDHKGDSISLEAIAEANPDWIFVLDRDAAVSKKGEFKPAAEIIAAAETLKNVKAIKDKHVIIAPADTYVNESIQTYITLFEEMAKAFADKK